MKRLSLFAVAGLAALALTASFAAASASATKTVLCTAEAKPCPAEDIKPAGSWFDVGALGGTFNLETKDAENEVFKCTYALFASQSTAREGNPEVFGFLPMVTTTALPASSCHIEFAGGSEECTAVTATQPRGYISSLSGGAAEVYVGAEGSTEPWSLTITCHWSHGTLIACTYTAPSFLKFKVSAFTGSEGQEVTLPATKLKVSGNGGSTCGTGEGPSVSMTNGAIASSDFVSTAL